MFCPKCGTELHNAAKFCSSCGTPIKTPAVNITPPIDQTNRQAEWSSKWNLPQQTKKQTNSKGYLSKWGVPIVVLVAVIVVCVSFLIIALTTQHQVELVALNYIGEKYCPTFGDDADSVEKIGSNRYIVTYDIDEDYDFWKLTGMLKVRVYKDSEEWHVDVEEENIDYDFEKNDNWYYITASGNREYLIKMIDFSRNKITLEYYSYDMGSYGGADDYDHGTITCDLKYDGENRCFIFKFMGDWRIYGSFIGYNQFETGAYHEYYQSSNKFSTLNPANPDDYWWYERAKRQTGDYDIASATDISKAKPGDVISFGKYEMDNNTSNGADDISWLVIDENDSGILVISKYCIAKQETSSSYETWETSVAREWLNNEFYSNAFTTEENNKIITSTIVNDDNADTEIDGGNDTSDKLFLLSIDEANKYFTSKEDRKAYGTLYLQELVGEDEDSFGWWLRTPGKRFVTLSSEQIYQSYVGSNGYVYTEGCTAAVYNNGLRPAMWISK